MSTTTNSSCWPMRDGLSALVDGEDPGMDRDVLDSHVARCPDCQDFARRVAAQARRLRIRTAEPVPDTTAQILAALPAGAAPRRQVPLRGLAASVVLVVVLAGAAFAGGRVLGGSGGSQLVSTAQVVGTSEASSQYPGATVLPVAYSEPNVQLTDTAGQPYNLATQANPDITLVYFGYTHCPDICPINMALSAQALRRLPVADRSKVKVVFVTTDPARDTPPVIQAWLNNFSPSFIGLAGTETQIHQAEKQVDMPLSEATSTGGDYQVVHAGYTLVYTPDGKAHIQVDDTENAAGFATTLEHLIAHGFHP